jgi:hypothetical protein
MSGRWGPGSLQLCGSWGPDYDSLEGRAGPTDNSLHGRIGGLQRGFIGKWGHSGRKKSDSLRNRSDDINIRILFRIIRNS